jgi:hypothetical protein
MPEFCDAALHINSIAVLGFVDENIHRYEHSGATNSSTVRTVYIQQLTFVSDCNYVISEAYLHTCAICIRTHLFTNFIS